MKFNKEKTKKFASGGKTPEEIMECEISVVTTEATCVEEGSITYTASCIFEEADNATTFSGFQPFFCKPLSFVRIIFNGVLYLIENL